MKSLLLTVLIAQVLFIAATAESVSEENPDNAQVRRIERTLEEFSDPITDCEIFVDKAVEIWKRAPAATKDLNSEKAWNSEKQKNLEDRCHAEPLLDVAQVVKIIPGKVLWTPDWQLYFLCRAFVEKNPQLCPEAAPLLDKPDKISGSGSFCLEGYEYLAAGSMIIARGPGAVERCEKLNDLVPRLDYEKHGMLPLPKDKASRRDICSSLVQGMDIQALCDKMGRMVLKETGEPMVPNVCLEPVCILRGEAAACARFNVHPFDVTLSSILASYRKAFTASDAKLCADSSLCRFLMGSGDKQCAEYGKIVKTQYCAALVSLRREQALKETPPSTSRISPELAELRGLLKSLIVHELKRPRLPEEQLLVEELKKFMLQTEKFISVRAVLQDIMKVKQAQFFAQFNQADSWVQGFEPRSHEKLPGLQKKLLHLHKRFDAAFKKFKSTSDR